MATKVQQMPAQEKREIVIPRERGNKAPVQVWLNGVRYSIPRGKKVEVPAGVAEILDHSAIEKDKLDDYNATETI